MLALARVNSDVGLLSWSPMNLEIKGIHVDGVAETQPAPDGQTFNVPIKVEIGERGKEGAEVFHFVAASPAGLEGELSNSGFKLLRGYILMSAFDMKVVRRSIENIVNHARSRETGQVAFFNRYGVYEPKTLTENISPTRNPTIRCRLRGIASSTALSERLVRSRATRTQTLGRF